MKNNRLAASILIAIAAITATLSVTGCKDGVSDDSVRQPSYTVVYDSNGGSGTMANSKFNTGESYTLPKNTFSKTGNTFIGWATDPSGSAVYTDEQSVSDLAGGGETVMLYAVWGSNSYMVTYNPNDGSSSLTYTYSFFTRGRSENLRTNTFTRDGYIFMGWATSASGSVVYADGQSVINLTNGDEVTLYAVWTNNGYTVAYNSNGGAGYVRNSGVMLGESFTLRLNTFSRGGYTFGGWATSADGAAVYTDEQEVSDLATTVGATVTLYAVWVQFYTVTYNANGGIGEMENSVVILGESHILRANAFTRTGYIFEGWATSATGAAVYTDEQEVSELAATAGATVTLYAVWSANFYTVVYNRNGGSGTMENSIVILGESFALRENEFTRTGYLFEGWADNTGELKYTDGQELSNLATTAGATVNLYAMWKINFYMVSYNANDGEGSMEPSQLIYGESQVLRTNTFTRSGYLFFGWSESTTGEVLYTDGQEVTDLITVPGEELALFAIWAQAYTVTYNANGGSGTMADSVIPYGIAQALSTNGFTRTGYHFTGWAGSPGGPVIFADGQEVSNLSSVAGAEVPLYAVWAGNAYTVAYNANGGSGSMVSGGFVYDEPQILAINDYTRVNHAFTGWATTPSGSVAYTDEEEVSNLTVTAGETVTLYAVWAHTFTVVYRANGGGGSMENSSHIYGTSGNLRTNTFTRNGYYSEGWSLSAFGSLEYADGQNADELNSSPGAEITLYAVWTSSVPGASLADKLAWLDINAASDADYIVEVDANETLSARTLSYSGRNNIGITLVGIGDERTIGNGTLFSIGDGVTLTLGNNITLRGSAAPTVVQINSGGTLVMKTGSRITGTAVSSASNSLGGGVRVNGGTFIMNDGAISGNTLNCTSHPSFSNSLTFYGGGVYVASGTFIMNGGVISGNRSINPSGPSGGGGVYVAGGTTFTMNGGIISGNSTSYYGAGVYTNGTFTMNGGQISGNANIGSNWNYGAGVYVNSGTFTMHGGLISDNRATTAWEYGSYGGGVYLNGGAFRVVSGTITGSNYASVGTVLGRASSNNVAQRGVFNGDTWTSYGNLFASGYTGHSTAINVVNGNLQ